MACTWLGLGLGVGSGFTPPGQLSLACTRSSGPDGSFTFVSKACVGRGEFRLLLMRYGAGLGVGSSYGVQSLYRLGLGLVLIEACNCCPISSTDA